MQFKRIYLIWPMLCSLFALSAMANDIGVMTFNLRAPADPPPHDWQSRKPRILSIIQHHQPDFIGVQEVTPVMMKDLHNELSAYATIGRGRDADGGGEGSHILFLQNRWKLDKQDHGTLQLSPTPDVPGSNGWGMQFRRIFTWAHLQEKQTGKFIYVFNTHFPLVPGERDLSVQLLARAIAGRKHKLDPVILTGDFNACEREASMQYLRGLGGSPVAMKDTYRMLHPNDITGTFHGFGTVDNCKVDYIYVSDDVLIRASIIIKENKNFASDHFAVVATVAFPP